MKRYILFTIIAFGFMLISCDKFLEENPTGSLTSESTLTSRDAGIALATGAYRSLYPILEGAETNGSTLNNGFEFPTGKSYAATADQWLYLYETDAVTGDLSYFRLTWNLWYQGVRDCNLAIKMIPTINGMTADDKSLYLGEVRTLRAFYYFCLVRYFGDVVLNTSVIDDITKVQKPRSSLKTIYDKVIIPDLEFAVNESKLADAPSSNGRVTKYVARMILADVYLNCAGYPYQEVNSDTTKNWCSDGLWTASQYPVNAPGAKEFLKKSQTQLNTLYGKYKLGTYRDLNKPELNNKGEAIFQAQFLSSANYNKLVWKILQIGSQTSLNNEEYGTYVPSTAYYNSFNAGDKRIQNRQMFFYSDTKSTKYDPNEGPAPAFYMAYLFKFYDSLAIKKTTYSSLNWNFYRYAEVLLMLTEVNWSLQQLGESVSENDLVKGINEVRARALLPTYVGADLSLQKIMSERAYELIYENKMLWDMRRTRRALKDGSGEFTALEPLVGHQPSNFSFKFTAKHLLSAISATEIDNNKNVLQNFGYTPLQTGQ